MLTDFIRAIAGGTVWRWREARSRRAMWAKYPEVEFQHGAVASGNCKFGPGVLILSGAHVRDVTVGPYTYFSSGSYIQNCIVGAYCSVGPRVRIGLGEHPTRGLVSTYPGFYSPEHVARARFCAGSAFEENKRTTIRNDVWLGEGCMIMDGVTVGDGAIVGAGAIVAKDVLPYTVVAGVPARLIRQRFTDEQIEFLKQLSWWDRDPEWIRSRAHLFQNIETLMGAVAAEERQ